MKKPPRLHSDERREAIVLAVKQVFAEKGFEGTTTKELAKAAGVSEALIFKHFPNKESLYDAMCDACAKGIDAAEFTRIMSLDPSTSTLVILVHFLISKIAHDITGDAEIKHRLMARSILGDGDFARLMLERVAGRVMPKFEECIKTANKTKDLNEIPIQSNLRFWFVHHLAVGLRLIDMPDRPAIDYKVAKESLIEQATWFALLGMGVKSEAIKRHYNPKALSLLGK